MKPVLEYIRSLFSHTSKERLGILVLSGILLIVIFLWQFDPFTKKPEKPDFTRFVPELEKFRDGLKKIEKKSSPVKIEKPPELFTFDPNTITLEQWVNLGMPKWKAQIIKNYLAKGGRFYQKEDLKKIYGITEQEYMYLKPYMNIIIKEKKWTDGKRVSHEDKPGHPIPEKDKPPRRFSLNHSDSINLQKVPGIGPVYSSRIIRYREMVGGFVNLGQVMEVYGLDTCLMPVLEEYMYVDSSGIRKLNLNQVQAWQLHNHPYLSRYQAKAIIQYREFKGKISTVSDLLDDKVLPDPVFHKIEPYFTVFEE